MKDRKPRLQPVFVLLLFAILACIFATIFFIVNFLPVLEDLFNPKPTIDAGENDSIELPQAASSPQPSPSSLGLNDVGEPTQETIAPLETTTLPTSEPVEAKTFLSGLIVFTCTRDSYNQLCLINAGGGEITRLTSKKANDYYASLSPDGRRIVFASNQSTKFEIYSINPEGNEEQQLTSDIGNLTAPEISPDGNWIVFASKVEGNSSIWLMDRDGSNPHPLTGNEWNEIDPVWSPDGSKISFAAARGGFVEIFSMNLDGSEIQQISRDLPRIGGRHSWSPDGRTIVLYAGVLGDRDIYLIDVGTGEYTRLTDGGNNTGPCYSPDGEWITFSSSRDGDHELFIMRKDGTDSAQLTFNQDDDWQPRWGIQPAE